MVPVSSILVCIYCVGYKLNIMFTFADNFVGTGKIMCVTCPLRCLLKYPSLCCVTITVNFSVALIIRQNYSTVPVDAMSSPTLKFNGQFWLI